MSKIVFSYRGKDSRGEIVSGSVEALDKEDALRQLHLLEERVHDITIIEAVQTSDTTTQQPQNPAVVKKGGMKKCPYCAEEIHDEAIKCKHCGELLKKEEPIEEKNIIEEHPAMMAYSGHFIFGIILILLMIVYSRYFILWGILLFVCAWATIKALIYRKITRYIITNKRLIIEKGLLEKNRDEIDIAHIRNISLRQDFVGKAWGYGTILIGTAGTAGYEIVMTAIKNPAEMIALIKKLQTGEQKE